MPRANFMNAEVDGKGVEKINKSIRQQDRWLDANEWNRDSRKEILDDDYFITEV